MLGCFSMSNSKQVVNKNAVLNFLLPQKLLNSLSNTYVNEFYLGNLEYTHNRSVFMKYIFVDLPIFKENSIKSEDSITISKSVRLCFLNLKYTLYSSSVVVHDYGRSIKFLETFEDLNRLKLVNEQQINDFFIEETIYFNFYDAKRIDFSDPVKKIVSKYKILYKNENIYIPQKPYIQFITQRVIGRKLF